MKWKISRTQYSVNGIDWYNNPDQIIKEDGMNLFEAVKSGKPFRRKNDKNMTWIEYTHKNINCLFSKDELLADDYEIKKDVIININDFWSAVCKVDPGSFYNNTPGYAHLAKALGL